MKILVIHNRYLEKGGEDEVVASEARMLEQAGHKVILYERSNEEIKNYRVLKKIKYFLKDIAWSKKSYEDVKRILEGETPDIAHVHNVFIAITPSVYSALSEANIPIVQTLHNYRLICPNAIFFRNNSVCEECKGGSFTSAVVHRCWKKSYLATFILVRIVKRFHKTCKGTIDVYIALSKFSRQKYLEADFPEDRIFIKQNFIDIEMAFEPKRDNYALFIGRLADYKGVDTILAVYKKLDKYCLKIIGDGPLYETIHKDLYANKNIELLGILPHDEVLEYLKKSSFLIFPSICYENMPRVIIEAFACGVPVIAGNLGSASEMVEDQVTGLLFKAGDYMDLAKKIELLLNNREKAAVIGRNARRVYEEKYTVEKNYEILMNIYEKARDGDRQKD